MLVFRTYQLILGQNRFASEASLALRWRDTRQATRFFVNKDGELEGCPLERVEGRQPFSRSEVMTEAGYQVLASEHSDVPSQALRARVVDAVLGSAAMEI